MSTSSSDPFEGLTLDGRFQLERLIGSGGMGRVYEATQLSVNRKVALKVMGDRASESERGRKRFLREAEALAALHHPAIVRIIEFGTDEELDLLYLAMEFVDGVPLGEVLAGGPLKWETSLRLTGRIAAGLIEAHAGGLVHRDLKPDNVMLRLTSNGLVDPVIVDFGVALDETRNTRLTAEGEIQGTPKYMAPEQAKPNATIGPATDLYAVGSTLFHMLTGDVPFSGATAFSLIVAKLQNEAPRASEYRPDLPEAVDALVADLLATEPEDRLGSARELFDRCAELVGSKTFELTAAEGNDPFALWYDGTTEMTAPPTPRRAPAPGAATVREPPFAEDDSGPPRADHLDSARPPALPPWAVGAAIVGAVLLLGGLAYFFRSDDSPQARPTTNPAVAPVAVVDAPPPREIEAAGVPGASKSADPVPSEAHEPPDAGTTGGGPTRGCGKKPPFVGSHPVKSKDWGDRYWMVHVPEGYDPEVPHPVVLLYHDSDRNAEYALKTRGFPEVADREGFVVIAPDAQNREPAWRMVSDVQFTNHAIQETASFLCLDDSRLFAFGHASGGLMVERLAAERPLSAASSTSYLRVKEDPAYEPTEPVPYLRFNADQDPYNPLQGGPNCIMIPNYSLRRINREWQEFSGCQSDPSPWDAPARANCETWQCEKAPYVSCIVRGGFDWVSDTQSRLLPCDTGPKTRYPYAEQVWRFFEANGRTLSYE